ncbi:MAG TPA: efflux RND transporter periplasmic adaptor subunit [Kiritimatiellia bacterium]|nr:efflux RND transporter periplasmic adaptor subunit [Kiritimatiellia bacterium]
MKRRWWVTVGMVVAVGLVLIGTCRRRGERGGADVREVTAGPLQSWSVYDGGLESRSQKDIMSMLGGSATIVEIVAEGTRVKKGDLLVRFDANQLERDIVKLERDVSMARAELDSLENAKLPLEIRDIEQRLDDAKSSLASETQYLDDCRELAKDELISGQEVHQQESKVEAAKKQLETIKMQLKLTKEYLHPSALEKAKASLAGSEQELKISKQQMERCTILAPIDGMVVYRPVRTGSEQRSVRVGDTIYRSQPFMAIPDMSDLIVRVAVPEAELSRVDSGHEVVVAPVAYPDLSLKGVVESVGSMAQSMSGRPDWQRYFEVVVALKESDPRLRPGMTVRTRILAGARDAAVLVPRLAVSWDGNKAFCKVMKGAGEQRRDVELGISNDEFFEVLSGLQPGEKVLVR